MPILLDLTDARRILRGRADGDADADLLLYLQATDELVADIVGPLSEPVPSRYRVAARIIFEHLWDHWQGAVPTAFQSGTDEDSVGAVGFAIPRAARELLITPKTYGARGPAFSFPEPTYCWPAL